MKPYVFCILLAINSFCSYAQSALGIDAGVSVATFYHSPFTYSNQERLSGSTHIRPIFGINYLRGDSAHRHFRWGGRLSLEQYSFRRETSEGGNSFGTLIEHESSFLFLSPVIDFGVGRKQVRHFFILSDIGVLMQAHQVTTEHYTTSGHQPSWSSSGDVSALIFRPGIGFSQHVQLNANWDIVFAEVGSVIIGNLTTIHGTGVHPGSVYITAGFERVFSRLPVPPKTAKKPWKSRISY
jgi:hypothetical protein